MYIVPVMKFTRVCVIHEPAMAKLPYRKGYCANNGSAIMRIDTYCGPQWVGFGVYG